MQEKSHLSIQVGPRFEDDGKWSIKVNADVTSNAANAQLEFLRQQLQGNLDLEWSLVVKLQALPGKASDLENGLKKLFEINLEDEFTMKTFAIGDIVWVSVKFLPENEADLIEPFNMFFAQGLGDVAQNQQNNLSLNVSSNFSFDQVKEAFQQKERIVSIIMRSLKILFQFQLNKNLAETMRNIIENFDPDLGNDPVMKFILKFKNFKVDLDFLSSEEAPEFVRLHGFFGKEIIKMIEQGHGELHKSKEATQQVADAIDSTAELYFTIPDFIAVKAETNLPGLSQIIINYGTGILDSF